jgi:hypothetical protein
MTPEQRVEDARAEASLVTRYRLALEWALDHAHEEHPYFPERSARAEEEWVYPYLVNGDGGFGGGAGEAIFFNALDAVEAASKEPHRKSSLTMNKMRK